MQAGAFGYALQTQHSEAGIDIKSYCEYETGKTKANQLSASLTDKPQSVAFKMCLVVPVVKLFASHHRPLLERRIAAFLSSHAAPDALLCAFTREQWYAKHKIHVDMKITHPPILATLTALLSTNRTGARSTTHMFNSLRYSLSPSLQPSFLILTWRHIGLQRRDLQAGRQNRVGIRGKRYASQSRAWKWCVQVRLVVHAW